MRFGVQNPPPLASAPTVTSCADPNKLALIVSPIVTHVTIADRRRSVSDLPALPEAAQSAASAAHRAPDSSGKPQASSAASQSAIPHVQPRQIERSGQERAGGSVQGASGGYQPSSSGLGVVFHREIPIWSADDNGFDSDHSRFADAARPRTDRVASICHPITDGRFDSGTNNDGTSAVQVINQRRVSTVANAGGASYNAEYGGPGYVGGAVETEEQQIERAIKLSLETAQAAATASQSASGAALPTEPKHPTGASAHATPSAGNIKN